MSITFWNIQGRTLTFTSRKSREENNLSEYKEVLIKLVLGEWKYVFFFVFSEWLTYICNCCILLIYFKCRPNERRHEIICKENKKGYSKGKRMRVEVGVNTHLGSPSAYLVNLGKSLGLWASESLLRLEVFIPDHVAGSPGQLLQHSASWLFSGWCWGADGWEEYWTSWSSWRLIHPSWAPPYPKPCSDWLAPCE